MRILVVDDEPDLCEILCFNLESEGFETERAYSAEAALPLLSCCHYDLVLLDVMMENMSGFEMARQMREKEDDTPIIFLTARDAESDMLDGFSSGADDYVTKPFSFPTVLARIRAVLKRSQTTDPTGVEVLCHGNLTVDLQRQMVTRDGIQVPLTKKEYNILVLLMRNKGEHFSRQQIIDKVWEDNTFVTDRSVDVHIARLRKKLGSASDSIVNHSGFGYVFVE